MAGEVPPADFERVNSIFLYKFLNTPACSSRRVKRQMHTFSCVFPVYFFVFVESESANYNCSKRHMRR